MTQLTMYILLLIYLTLSAGKPGGGPDNIQLQEETCIDCHSDLVEYPVMHPVAEDACDNCHQSTGASHPEEGVAGFTLMDRMPDLCFYCHEEYGPASFAHQPVKEGDCLSCHHVHGSSEPVLLKLPEQQLCLSCHQEIQQLMRGKNKPHTAISDGGCIICHQSHGSEVRTLLVGTYPEETYVPASAEHFELCFLCHDTDILDAEETDWATGFRNEEQNLHRLHIQGNKGRNCRLCHNLHGSPQKYMIEEKVSFGDWEMRMNFKPVENGGSCLPGCHGLLTYSR